MDLYGTATPPRPAGSISSSDSPLESHVSDFNQGAVYGSGASDSRLSPDAASQSAPANAAPSVPAACLGCRAKHLKCDGNTPCARCVSSAIECVYVASRRGYKGPRRAMAPNPNKRHASSSPDARGGGDIVPSGAQGPGPDNCPMLLGAGIAPGLTSTAFTGGTTTNGSSPAGAAAPFLSAASSMNHLQLYRNPPFSTPLDAIQHGAPPMAPIISIEDKCFDSFYYHYHAAHPFVLPKEHLSRHVRETGQKLEHLMTAMRYVGSLFLQAGPARASYLDEALRLCQSPATARDGFLVQALLLLIVALDGSCQQDKARDLLGEAERIAIEIGLNTREYATLHGRGLPILEESWRRTWWDLYVCDGMVAGVHRVTNFYLYDATAIGTLPGLPCEESEYLSGNIPHPMYLEDFEDQVFSGEDRTFSSFAYRIAAIRNLGRFMRCPPIMFPEDENLVKMDTHLTNWRLHLPPGKRDPIDKSCAPDEMLFQAHFITTACTIMLHQPHSQLDASPARSVNSCAPYRAVPTGDAFNSHTRHTITAACDIARMITYAVPLQHHTHFFTCVITMASIVHLSKWALYFIPDEDDLREQIRLSIGALSKLSVIWKAAATACGQVKGVAQEIYRAKKAAQLTPAFWIGFTQAEMINSLNVDDNVMSEIDSMLSSVTSAPQ